MKDQIRQVGVLLVFCVLGTWLTAEPAGGQVTGSITGTVDKPDLVTAVSAVDRIAGKRGKRGKIGKSFMGKFDAASGRFTIDGLPLGATYDCIVDMKGGRLEGVNLKVPPSDYEEEQPLSAEDIETVKTKARRMNTFEDVVETMVVTGNIQHAAVLLNKLRTRPFYASKPGEVIWRAELWRFERPEETWVKRSDRSSNVILYRERIRRSDYEKKSITFDPALGGLRPTRQRPTVDLGSVRLPSNRPGIRLRIDENKRSGSAEAG